MGETRYLDLQGVADYLSIGRTTVQQLVERNVLPKPIYLTPRLPRWDRHALDAAVARNAGIAVQSADDPTEAVRELCNEFAKGRSSGIKAPRRRYG